MKTKIVLAIFIGLILGNVAVTSPAVVCTAFGTLTANLSLCLPASGETGWDTAIDNNFKVLDSLFPGALIAGNGKLLIGNGAGFALNPLTGTASQVVVTNGAGTITLSTPQNIDTAASVQFGSVLTRILRVTQVTPPTCLDAKGVNVCPGALALGSDTALRFTVSPIIAAASRSLNVTFNVPFAAAPACVASWNGSYAYGYYIQAVSASTTVAVVTLGGDKTTSPSWSPFDQGAVMCTGVQ